MCELTMSRAGDASAGLGAADGSSWLSPWPRPPLRPPGWFPQSPLSLSAKPWPCRMRVAGRVRGSRSPEQWTLYSQWPSPALTTDWPRLSSGLAWLPGGLARNWFWKVFEAGNVGVLTERFVGYGETVSEAL